jgi:hypothetical protein
MIARLVDAAAALGLLAFCAGFPIAILVIGTSR